MKVLGLLLLLAGCLCLRLDSVGLIDYDEAAYAEVSREMVAADTWLEPRLNGAPWFEKPPLLYWTQIVGYRVLGLGETGARLGNALGMILLLGVMYRVARRPLGARRAVWTIGVLGSSVGFVFLTRVALTDGLLSLLLFSAVACIHRALEEARAGGRGNGWMLAAATCASVGMLAKGLVAFVLPAGSLFFFLLWERRWRWMFRPVWLLGSLAIVSTLGLSWYLALGLFGSQGFGFMRELFLEHHVGRFLDPKEGHHGAVWYYLPVLACGLLPWSLHLIPSLSPRRRLGRGDEEGRLLRLMLVFAVLTVAFFTAAATKLPNYVFPAMPPLALIVAAGIREPTGTVRTARWCAHGLRGLLVLLALAQLASPMVLARLPQWLTPERAAKVPGLAIPLELGVWPWLASALLILGIAASVVFHRRGQSLRETRALATAFFAFLLVLVHGLLPRYDAHFQEPLRRLTRMATSRSSDEPLLLVGLRRRASVCFYGRTRTELIRRDDPVNLGIEFAERRVALTTEAFFEDFRGLGSFEVLGRDHGYLLVEGVIPPSRDEPDTPPGAR